MLHLSVHPSVRTTSCQRISSLTTGKKFAKLSQITPLGMQLCMKVGIGIITFLPKVMALCKFFLYAVYREKILSTQLLQNYRQEIHQTFTDYLPWCVVVHEVGDWCSHVSTKSYGPLFIFLICSI